LQKNNKGSVPYKTEYVKRKMKKNKKLCTIFRKLPPFFSGQGIS